MAFELRRSGGAQKTGLRECRSRRRLLRARRRLQSRSGARQHAVTDTCRDDARRISDRAPNETRLRGGREGISGSIAEQDRLCSGGGAREGHSCAQGNRDRRLSTDHLVAVASRYLVRRAGERQREPRKSSASCGVGWQERTSWSDRAVRTAAVVRFIDESGQGRHSGVGLRPMCRHLTVVRKSGSIGKSRRFRSTRVKSFEGAAMRSLGLARDLAEHRYALCLPGPIAVPPTETR